MSLDRIFDIAGSGMSAQSIRLNTTASNIANAETASSSTGDVYRARKPVFAAVQHDAMKQAMGGDFLADTPESKGVEVKGILESDAPLEMRYQPDHPQANEQGYVYYPNVNVVEEMADMMSASKAYETNVQVADTTKRIFRNVLRLGQGS